MHVCSYLCMSLCVHAHMYVCMYIYILCVCVYMHACMIDIYIGNYPLIMELVGNGEALDMN